MAETACLTAWCAESEGAGRKGVDVSHDDARSWEVICRHKCRLA